MKWNRERIEQAFSVMEDAGWNISEPLEWSFFFLDRNKEKLTNLYQELKDYDYAISRLEFRDSAWQLILVKTEILTPEKLHRRNMAFEELAHYYKVYSYDGWEVGRLKK